MGRPGRFRDGTKFKSYVGLAPKACETGETDRKGQSMSKAGPSLLRATFYRAAGTARRQDPQLAKIYHTQMAERGANHLKACCVVAGHLAERAWAVLHRGTPYVICDNHGNPVTPAEAKQIIAERWTVPEEIRKPRRSRKIAGKAPQAALTRPDKRGGLPRPDRRGPAARQSTTPPDQHRRPPAHPPRPAGETACPPSAETTSTNITRPLDRAASIGNQIPPPPPLTCKNTGIGSRRAGASCALVSFIGLSYELHTVPPPGSAAGVVAGQDTRTTLDDPEHKHARRPSVRPAVHGWPGPSATGRIPANLRTASHGVIEEFWRNARTSAEVLGVVVRSWESIAGRARTADLCRGHAGGCRTFCGTRPRQNQASAPAS